MSSGYPGYNGNQGVGYQQPSQYPFNQEYMNPPPYDPSFQAPQGYQVPGPQGPPNPYAPGAYSQGNYPPSVSPYGDGSQQQQPYPPQNPSGYPPQPPYPQQQPQQGGNNFFPGAGMMPVLPKLPTDPDVMQNSDDGGDFDLDNKFSDKKIRHAFIKKVYLILTAQLLVTFGFIALFVFVKPVSNWVKKNQWFYWTSYGVFLVTYIMLACPCFSGLRRKFPWNFICLSIFTVALSILTGTISSTYDTNIVLIAVGVTAGVCLAISIFAIQTKIDFTLCSGFLFVFGIVFMIFGIVCIIVNAIYGKSFILQIVYGAVGALLFSLFLLFDTQMIIGGKNRKHQMSPEEYIYGALQLYVDIVNLFLLILSLVGAKKN